MKSEDKSQRLTNVINIRSAIFIMIHIYK